MKYLLLIVVVGVVLWLMGSGRRQRMQQERRPPAPGPKTAPVPVEMVACAHCGLNLPLGEALQDGSARPYCSEAHRAAGPR